MLWQHMNVINAEWLVSCPFKLNMRVATGMELDQLQEEVKVMMKTLYPS